jgi:hypothetical protein
VFGKPETQYLGHIICGIKPHPAEIEKIATLSAPRNLKKLRAFLGFVTYYREFISGFAKIATPLYALMSKSAVYTWSPACQQAFDQLRNALCTAPILKKICICRPNMQIF